MSGKTKKSEVKTPTEVEVPMTCNGLPWQGYAFIGSKIDPEHWLCPHHGKTIFRAIQGKIGLERTVDWDNMPAIVESLSPASSQRLHAEPEVILAIAQHLASHYRKANKPLPNTLAMLV